MRLLKTLSANDLGLTGSHQSGFLVPKDLVKFLPLLETDVLNPDVWLHVTDSAGNSDTWRYVHYNNRVVSSGTRNEYRVTRTGEILKMLGARPGDGLAIEFAEPRDRKWTVSIRRASVRSASPDTQSAVLRLDRSQWGERG